MAFSNTIKSSPEGVPVSQQWVPNVGWVVLKGSPNTTTDASGAVSAASVALDQSLVLTGQLQNAQTGNANGTPLTITGMGSVLFEVIMTGFTGTVNFEGAGPNANYDPLWVNQFGTNTVALTAVGSVTTTTHLYELANASGLQTVRCRTSGTSAGNVTVNAYALPFTLGPRVVNANQAGAWTVQPGNTPNTTPWLVSRAGADSTILASAARTTTQTSADFTNVDARGVKVVLDMTTVGTGNVTLTIQGKDVASGKYYTLLAGVAVTTNSTNIYTVFPGATITANVSANDTLPHTWRVQVVANNANSAVYSVGASTLL